MATLPSLEMESPLLITSSPDIAAFNCSLDLSTLSVMVLIIYFKFWLHTLLHSWADHYVRLLRIVETEKLEIVRHNLFHKLFDDEYQ
jgi:hypothetical protein